MTKEERRAEWKKPSERLPKIKPPPEGFVYEFRKTVRGKQITASSTEDRDEALNRYWVKVDAYLDATALHGRRRAKEYFSEWLLDVKASHPPNTYITYERAYRLYIEPTLKRKWLDELSVADVNAIQRAMRTKNLSANTINVVRGVLSVALHIAEREGLIGRNVVGMTTPPKITSNEVIPLSSSEVAQFLAAAKHHRYYPLFLLALTTGMRRGEICGLRWRDINFTHNVINLRVQLQEVEGKWQTVPLKGKARGRTIHVPPVTMQALHEVRQEAIENPQDLVFTRPDGQPVLGNTLNWLCKKLMIQAGIPPRRFHVLRHSCASLLAAMGHTPHEIQRLLGHATPTITQNIYTHLFADHEGRTAASMEAFLGTALGTTSSGPDFPLSGKGNLAMEP